MGTAPEDATAIASQGFPLENVSFLGAYFQLRCNEGM